MVATGALGFVLVLYLSWCHPFQGPFEFGEIPFGIRLLQCMSRRHSLRSVVYNMHRKILLDNGSPGVVSILVPTAANQMERPSSENVAGNRIRNKPQDSRNALIFTKTDATCL